MDRAYPSRPIVGVGAVVVMAPGEEARRAGGMDQGVVLIRRRFEPLAGHWSLPGGALEIGEPLAAGIAREVREETGLDVMVGPLIDVVDRVMRDADGRVEYHFVLVDYLCRPVGGRLTPGSDVSDAVVADPQSLDTYQLSADTTRVILCGLEMAGSWRPGGPTDPAPGRS